MLTAQDVRDYLSDNIETNHLLDDVEFSDRRIALAKKMAVADYNIMPPRSSYTEDTMPAVSTLLWGTLYHLYTGQMAIAARNTMSYSDGGLDIPIEERFPYYSQMSQLFKGKFDEAARAEKIQANMEAGYNAVYSDYAAFPMW